MKKIKFYKVIFVILLIFLISCTPRSINLENSNMENEDMHLVNNMASMNQNAMTFHAGKDNSAQINKYAIKLIIHNINTSLDSELEFNIKDSTTGQPILDLEIVHDKIMHIIIVRNDLKYFDHIHPTNKGEGKFSVPYSFYTPGDYRIWIDFTINKIQHIVDFDLNIVDVTIKDEQDFLGNVRVIMQAQDKIKVGENTKLDFIINDEGNNPINIKEKFLAANAHAIIIDKSLGEFGHTHDEKIDGDNIISFNYSFMKSGLHKIWVQFQVDNIVRIKEFEIGVE